MQQHKHISLSFKQLSNSPTSPAFFFLPSKSVQSIDKCNDFNLGGLRRWCHWPGHVPIQIIMSALPPGPCCFCSEWHSSFFLNQLLLGTTVGWERAAGSCPRDRCGSGVPVLAHIDMFNIQSIWHLAGRKAQRRSYHYYPQQMQSIALIRMEITPMIKNWQTFAERVICVKEFLCLKCSLRTYNEISLTVRLPKGILLLCSIKDF